MLKPAILYKEELTKLFAEQLYTDDYFYFTGYVHTNCLPDIHTEENLYQYAIIDNERVVGFLSYIIWEATDTAMNFALYSFERGNTIVGRDVYTKLRELINTHRRVEWRMVGGNPVEKTYNKFCSKHGGNHVVLRSVCKDLHGNYRDEHIYEIVKTT